MVGRVLLVDDDPSLGELLVEGLRDKGFDCEFTTDVTNALQVFSREEFDTVVTDLSLPVMSGLDLCKRLVESRPDVPVIVLTAYGSFDAAVGAIRSGAYDFITKPFDLEVVALAIERAVRHRRLRDEVRKLRDAVSELQHFGEVIGSSPAMHEVREMLSRLAESEATLVLTGESGTGKEVVARAVHQRSRRAAGPFVALNCAAVPEALLESELFGHVRGAFTDAKSARVGLLVQANGGTLMLDEIGDMPISLQPKLLRALEDRVVRPVGGAQEIKFDARIIAATHRDLEALVEKGAFREDLYYRLNVVHIALPPLRSRGGDVLQLAKVFLERYAAHASKDVKGISPAAAEKLLGYHWPGNVRELRNAIERAVALTRFDTLTVDDLPEKVRNHRDSHVIVAGQDPSELVTLEEVERRYIRRVMQAAGDNKSLAAQILGLDRKTLYRKLRMDREGGRPRNHEQN
ncbi:MAG TPA: sigma-54 dependent transcriptional regulator [Polyangiaceae bacterium]|nr:sigma-54 dependent transcriptional regulator [Polyangiaceae bacterium]